MSLLFSPAKKTRLVANFVDSPGTFFLKKTPTAYGVNVWFKLNSTPSSDQCLLHYKNASTASEVKISLTSALKVKAFNSNDTPTTHTATSVATLVVGDWYMFTAISNGGNLNYYINGAFDFVNSTASAPNSDLDNFSLGRSLTGTDYFDGEIYQWFKVSGAIFGGTEITALWNNGTPLADPTSIVVGGSFTWAPLSVDLTPDGTPAEGFELGSGIDPVFVDDTALTGLGSWSAPAYQALPNSRNLSLIPKNFAGVDLIVMGDSFSRYDQSRATLHLANEMARIASAPIKKVYFGYEEFGANVGMLVREIRNTLATPPTFTLVDDGAYEFPKGAGANEFFSVPVGGGQAEYDIGAAPTDQWLYKVMCDIASGSFTGPATTWIGAGDSLSLQVGFYKMLTNQMPDLALQDNGGASTEHVLTDGAYTAGALNFLPAFTLSSELGTGRVCFVDYHDAGKTSALNKFLGPAGAIADNTSTASGLGIMQVGEINWDLVDFANDAVAVLATDRQFSNAQIQPAFDAFIDAGKHTVLCLFIDSEDNMTTHVPTIISRFKTIIEAAGSTNYTILLVSQPPNRLNLYNARVRSQAAAVDLDALAQSTAKVAHLALGKLLSGAYLHDSGAYTANDANDAPLQALVDYDAARSGADIVTDLENTPGRVWLDAGDVHPADFNSARGLGMVFANELYAEASSANTSSLSSSIGISI